MSDNCKHWVTGISGLKVAVTLPMIRSQQAIKINYSIGSSWRVIACESNIDQKSLGSSDFVLCSKQLINKQPEGKHHVLSKNWSWRGEKMPQAVECLKDSLGVGIFLILLIPFICKNAPIYFSFKIHIWLDSTRAFGTETISKTERKIQLFFLLCAHALTSLVFSDWYVQTSMLTRR